jgi:hypothetical protein
MPNRETRLGSLGFRVENSIYLIRMQGHPNSPAIATDNEYLIKLKFHWAFSELSNELHL